MMNYFKQMVQLFAKKRQYNFIKIVSLGCGLTLGLILLAKVHFEYTYNNFYPDKERIYQVIQRNPTQEGGVNEMERLPGGFVYHIGKDLPQVETATRYRTLSDEPLTFLHAEKHPQQGVLILADSCLFDVLSHRIIAGDAKSILSTPMQAMVSRSFADKLGAGAIGETIESEKYPGRVISIQGIFEDIPENSSFRYDVVLSLPSLSHFESYVGSFRADDHNQFIGLIKLYPGIHPSELETPLKNLQKQYQEAFFYESLGWSYHLTPLKDVHTRTSEVKLKRQIMLALGISLLLVTVINYILLVISTIMDRYREITLYKCYGAQQENIVSLILTETSTHLFLSLALGATLVTLFKDSISELLGTSWAALFTPGNVGLIAGICLLILLVASYIPARILTKMSVSFALQSYKTSRKGWKLFLLFVQFVFISGFFVLLVIIGMQYNQLMNKDLGYRYDHLIYMHVANVEQDKRQLLLEQLAGEAIVTSVTAASTLPFYNHSGGWLSSPDDSYESHALSLGWVTKDYLSTLNISLQEGADFNEYSESGDILISSDLAEEMIREMKLTDGVIGAALKSGAYGGLRTVRGVFEKVNTSSFKRKQDERPVTIAFSGTVQDFIIVELNRLTGENTKRVQALAERIIPGKYIPVVIYKDSLESLYNKERLERNTLLICCFVTLMIVLMGLSAYLNAEINRRTAEIAIRKINGAHQTDIYGLFIKDILLVAVPALILGSLLAYRVGLLWLENFYLKIPLSLWWLPVCIVLLLILIIVIIIKELRVKN